MINGMYLSTMGAMVQSTRHATIANNLSNANTSGFKPDWTVFRALDAESALQGSHRGEIDEILEETGGGVWLDRTCTNFRGGTLRQTGNPLNAALEDSDPGQRSFFRIREPSSGKMLYTRDGHFTVREDGALVTHTGAQVLTADGDQIEVPPGSQLSIARDGSVIDQNNEIVGQIGVVRTADLDELTKIGGNAYEASDEARFEVYQEGVLNRYVEDSATDPIQEMVNMIEAHRTYETNMKFLTIQDETLGDTVRRVAALA